MPRSTQLPPTRTASRKRLLFLIGILGAILTFHLIHTLQRVREEQRIALEIARNKQFREERTENLHRDSFQKMFLTKAISLSISSGQAILKPGPDLPLTDAIDSPEPDSGNHAREIIFTMPGETLRIRDNHSSTDFTVKKITPDALVLTYHSTFDHRSFGKNLITTDKGEFTLPPFDNP